MYCPHCGAQVPDKVSFCPFCGKPTSVRTPGDQANASGMTPKRTEDARPAVPQQQVTAQIVSPTPQRRGLSIRVIPAGVSALVFLCAGLWLSLQGLASFSSLVKLLYYCDVSEEILSVVTYLVCTVLAGACAAFAAVETILAERTATAPSFKRYALANAVCAFVLVALGRVLAGSPLETWMSTTLGDSMSSALSASFSLVTEDLGPALLSFGIALAALLVARFALLDAKHVTRER